MFMQLISLDEKLNNSLCLLFVCDKYLVLVIRVATLQLRLRGVLLVHQLLEIV